MYVLENWSVCKSGERVRQGIASYALVLFCSPAAVLFCSKMRFVCIMLPCLDTIAVRHRALMLAGDEICNMLLHVTTEVKHYAEQNCKPDKGTRVTARCYVACRTS